MSAEHQQTDPKFARLAMATQHQPLIVGRFLKVLKGRTVPKGTIGIIFWTGDSGWGWGVGFRSMHGELFFTSYKNVEAYEPTPEEEQHTRFMLKLVQQVGLGSKVIIPDFPRERLELDCISCRFCHAQLAPTHQARYNHLRVCQEIPHRLLPTALRHLRKKPPAFKAKRRSTR